MVNLSQKDVGEEETTELPPPPKLIDGIPIDTPLPPDAAMATAPIPAPMAPASANCGAAAATKKMKCIYYQ